MFFIPTSVILFVFFLYLNERNKKKVKKEAEKRDKAYQAYEWQQGARMRELYKNLPPGYGLKNNLKNEKLSEEYITLLEKPMHHYTEADNHLYDFFCSCYRTYKLPL